jgi:dipeptidyl aminopeptidase/acylaminoacyl peptidase
MKINSVKFNGRGIRVLGGCLVAVTLGLMGAQADVAVPVKNGMQYSDVFELELATNPEITPDGQAVVYERRAMDVMTDSMRSNIWTVGLDGGNHRPVLSGKAQYRMPRFSPDGSRMAYLSNSEGKTQIYVRWLDTGVTARLTDLALSPSNISWAPDSQSIAFTMFAPSKGPSFFKMPAQPKGAKWAGQAKVIDQMTYRIDGVGYLPNGYTHVFVVPAEGGTPRQITSGDYNHNGGVSWTSDSSSIVISANRSENWQMNPRESEIYAVSITGGGYTQLTRRVGPDRSPKVSPNGTMIAYVGNDENGMSHQNADLYVMSIDGSNVRNLTADLDRGVGNIQWNSDGSGLYYSYDRSGKKTVAFTNLAGNGRIITNQLGGVSLGRPYANGTYRAAPDGRIVYTINRTDRPADLGVVDRIGSVIQLTSLNEDALGKRQMASVERVAVNSSFDGREVEGWIVKPAGFDPSRKYPLILEIHGGPHAAYGPSYSTEVQLMASMGYMVLYTNPRGSTSYGADFANLIHHNYPSQDYDDMMNLVDATIAQGSVDTDQLYVTGGSGGGVLTAWIVGKTDRFRAAVVAKPVINWSSFVLTADFSPTFIKYWFPDTPWNASEHYWARSPLSLVGNVKTPTMLLSGVDDHRTPISEAEQYYKALKLSGVPTAMVRVPGAGHGIAGKPSNLVQKVGNVLGWFSTYSGAE